MDEIRIDLRERTPEELAEIDRQEKVLFPDFDNGSPKLILVG